MFSAFRVEGNPDLEALVKDGLVDGYELNPPREQCP